MFSSRLFKKHAYDIFCISRVLAWYSYSTRKKTFLLHLGDPEKRHQIRFDKCVKLIHELFLAEFLSSDLFLLDCNRWKC